MAEHPEQPLKVFLCHASADKLAVRVLYKRLVADGIDAWLDEEKLMPGQYWRDEISSAVQNADAVIVCLSDQSITKEGFVQKEIRFALDFAEEKPEGTIYLIPARLEDCEVPRRLQYWQWVNLFFDGKKFDETGYQNLLRSLRTRALKVGARLPNVNTPRETPETPKRSPARIQPIAKPAIKKEVKKRKSTSKAAPPASKVGAVEEKENRPPDADGKTSISQPPVAAFLGNLNTRTILIAAGIGLLCFFSILPLMTRGNRSTSETQTALPGDPDAQLRVYFSATAAFRQTETAKTPDPATRTVAAAFTQLALPARAANPATQTLRAGLTQVALAASPPNPATQTVGAAFTQIAVSTMTIISTSTRPVLSPTPTPPGVRSDATLLLDRSYLCQQDPSLDAPTIETIARGVRLPIYGRNEQGDWWLVQIQLENFEFGYCWINGGTVEGNPASIVTVQP